eukprot:g1437.t1
MEASGVSTGKGWQRYYFILNGGDGTRRLRAYDKLTEFDAADGAAPVLDVTVTECDECWQHDPKGYFDFIVRMESFVFGGRATDGKLRTFINTVNALEERYVTSLWRSRRLGKRKKAMPPPPPAKKRVRLQPARVRTLRTLGL